MSLNYAIRNIFYGYEEFDPIPELVFLLTTSSSQPIESQPNEILLKPKAPIHIFIIIIGGNLMSAGDQQNLFKPIEFAATTGGRLFSFLLPFSQFILGQLNLTIFKNLLAHCANLCIHSWVCLCPSFSSFKYLIKGRFPSGSFLCFFQTKTTKIVKLNWMRMNKVAPIADISWWNFVAWNLSSCLQSNSPKNSIFWIIKCKIIIKMLFYSPNLFQAMRRKKWPHCPHPFVSFVWSFPQFVRHSLSAYFFGPFKNIGKKVRE